MSIVTRNEDLNKELKEVKEILKAIQKGLEERAADWEFNGLEKIFIKHVRFFKNELTILKKRVCCEGDFAKADEIQKLMAKEYIGGRG